MLEIQPRACPTGVVVIYRRPIFAMAITAMRYCGSTRSVTCGHAATVTINVNTLIAIVFQPFIVVPLRSIIYWKLLTLKVKKNRGIPYGIAKFGDPTSSYECNCPRYPYDGIHAVLEAGIFPRDFEYLH